jgi:hypothetical protein
MMKRPALVQRIAEPHSRCRPNVRGSPAKRRAVYRAAYSSGARRFGRCNRLLAGSYRSEAHHELRWPKWSPSPRCVARHLSSAMNHVGRSRACAPLGRKVRRKPRRRPVAAANPARSPRMKKRRASIYSVPLARYSSRVHPSCARASTPVRRRAVEDCDRVVLSQEHGWSKRRTVPREA